MNTKLQKTAKEIEWLERKISDYQARLRDLKRLQTDLENADIVAAVRGVDVPHDELTEFIRMFKERQGRAIPDIPTTNTEKGDSADED